jgi:hypothetical protein
LIFDLGWKEDSSSRASITPDSDLEELCWIEATGDLYKRVRTGSSYLFHEGCRIFHRRQIVLKNRLRKFSVSFVWLGEMQYIAGLMLVDSTGKITSVGYWNTNEHSLGQSLDVDDLCGFNLAIGSRGIHALQCILPGGRISQWLGSADCSLNSNHGN